MQHTVFRGEIGFWVILGSVCISTNLYWEEDDKLLFIQKHIGMHICVVKTNAFLPKTEKKLLTEQNRKRSMRIAEIISLRILISALLMPCRISVLKSEIIWSRLNKSSRKNALCSHSGYIYEPQQLSLKQNLRSYHVRSKCWIRPWSQF